MAELSNEPAPGPALRMGPGARLKAGREAQNQSLEQAARHLRLDEPTMAAIESDRYPAHVPSTFLRGYLRAYAKWLELPADEIVAAYNAQQPDEATLSALKSLLPLPESGHSRSGKWFWLTVLALVAAIAVAVIVMLLPHDWLNQWRNSEAVATHDAGAATILSATEPSSGELALSLAPEQPLPAVDGEADLLTATTPAPADATHQLATSAAAAAPSSEKKSEPATSEQLSASGETIELTFIEDCWIRVTDAGGSVLSVGIKQNGQRLRLSGIAPLTAVLGNPNGVQVRHNGRPVDLSGYPGGRPATLTIQAQANE